MNKTDREIIDEINSKIIDDENYLDFLSSNTKEYTHSYHTYPAMMIPQVAREFIEISLKYNRNIKNVFDPFMGSGTTMVEGLLKGLDVYGVDVNPLSVFMSKAKTSVIDPDNLRAEYRKLVYRLNRKDSFSDKQFVPEFDNINFWFKPNIIHDLSRIKKAIDEVSNDTIKIFFLAAFSETVRYVSNTRNNEFKLYRMSKDKLDGWNPKVFEIYDQIIMRNISGNKDFFQAIRNGKNAIELYNVSSQNLDSVFDDKKFDLLVTSPPYGDSGTTVAYGQFSRLSLQWLNLDLDIKLNQLDNMMLGGKVSKNQDIERESLESETIDLIYNEVAKHDKRRADEVLQFYIDLDKSFRSIARKMRKGSYQFWVVANRTVKGIKIPTDKIIVELLKKHEIQHLHSFHRNIPNKRMPSINSPTNKTGKHAATMTKEIILMFRTK